MPCGRARNFVSECAQVQCACQDEPRDKRMTIAGNNRTDGGVRCAMFNTPSSGACVHLVLARNRHTLTKDVTSHASPRKECRCIVVLLSPKTFSNPLVLERVVQKDSTLATITFSISRTTVVSSSSPPVQSFAMWSKEYLINLPVALKPCALVMWRLLPAGFP